MVFITIALAGLSAVLAHSLAERLELRRLSYESPAWPRVSGVVLGGRQGWSSSPRSGQSYWPTIDYRYSVGTTAFEGDRVSFRASYDRSEAEAAVARYSAGSTVTVWYRPGDPRRSVLEPGTWDDGRALRVLVPIAIMVTALALFCLALLVLVSRPRQ